MNDHSLNIRISLLVLVSVVACPISVRAGGPPELGSVRRGFLGSMFCDDQTCDDIPCDMVDLDGYGYCGDDCGYLNSHNGKWQNERLLWYLKWQRNKKLLHPQCSPVCHGFYGYHQTCWRPAPDCNTCPRYISTTPPEHNITPGEPVLEGDVLEPQSQLNPSSMFPPPAPQFPVVESIGHSVSKHKSESDTP